MNMLKDLKKYSRIFLAFQTAGLAKDLSLRFNLLISLSGSLCFFYLHLITFALVINRFNFPGWSQGEIWVMLFTFQVFTYLCFYLFWRGLVHTPRDIRSGTFDVILSKPVNSRFLSLIRNGSAHNWISALLSIIYLILSVSRYHLDVTPVGVILFVVFLLFSLWLFHCFSSLLITLNFKYGFLPGTSAAAFEIQEVFKYPAGIFSTRSLWIWLLVIPFSLLTTLPASALLLKPLSANLLIFYVFILAFFTFAADQAWNSSLRHYSSASS
ncbi:MAG: hypothetical protein UX87_C0002G0013 [Candidatus Amesbacteria bacterium GW2011_GWA1_47_16]|uniref:Uncharacterized protein n=4 Tax=Candidatus Amesiibacteriota TaxID=1752730 RepID=A0A0G1S733_9BACT|nr:MAG: hypothetical protein UX87_C0002G0013 [Candidatus Amesbacteria bacterium GW2011_GWA1_47_16]KKU65187.1 MAG: hypothetical protein UX86_C0001G0043 [Candidatus Amesbacteria bacterium GW2011_GWC1_47_15]KKU98452.1 MAG: hypothetical protein UY28_C0001G0002 [Candidatus Amesbacteria bacterium GW2011_GWB1_48_13]OGD00330.1 MAG: hypothetical protein A2972_00800 [Candidatus Amesbacteria bacterium RIFCSPLOWO2_01_FULL_47_33]OGD00902.1 MAG: hypothetical protein A2701_00640 [Candidatus Amesbacteria bacte